jgi:hypothetical protein
MSASGTLYAFCTVENSCLYKVGFTQQPLAARLRGYLGPSRPRTVVVDKRVDDAPLAELHMLKLVGLCRLFAQRKDLGNEWFEFVQGTREECHAALLEMAHIVVAAVRSTEASPPGARPPPCAQPPLSAAPEATETRLDLRGMGRYFSSLDAFIQEADGATLAGVEAAMDAFERSDACPVFAEYTPYDRSVRLAVCKNRYVL